MYRSCAKLTGFKTLFEANLKFLLTEETIWHLLRKF